MKGRRTAAMLCVLLAHALFVLVFLQLTKPEHPTRVLEPPAMELVNVEYDLDRAPQHEIRPLDLTQPRIDLRAPESPASSESASGESAAITTQPWVDWPIEAKESAARILAQEAEAERIAKMFAGPQGTWASLTKREQSELKKFRWAPGVDGLERDENGTAIYQMKNGCVLVAFVFIGCPIGAKPPPYGDLFKDMRLYFDEQRLPQTQEGNGTEPESRRPPKWSKPLPERDR
jgi:hypothetical protein